MKRQKYLNADEVKRLRTVTAGTAALALQKGHTYGVMVWTFVDFALSTGLRVSEMAAISIKDIDLKRGFIKVKRKKKKKPFIDTLAISPQLVRHLTDYLNGRTAGKLFIGQRGNITKYGLMQIWKAAIRKAGLPKEYSVHCARHTLAVRLLKKTGNLRQVQKQLGHASPTTTANMYADVSFEDMQAGVTDLYEQ